MSIELTRVESVECGSKGLELLEQGVMLEHFGTKVETMEQFMEQTEPKMEFYGDPEESAKHWHMQREGMSCAVACQEFIAEELIGVDFSEDKMRAYAEKHSWYETERGTYLSDVGKLLETMGLNIERSCNATLEDIAQELKDGGKIICGVNNRVLQNAAYARQPGIRANHAVQVTGIEQHANGKCYVVLNDPGVANGAGVRIDSDTFLKAWKTGNCFMVTAHKGGNV